MISRKMQAALSAIESLTAQEKQAVVKLLQGDGSGLTELGIDPPGLLGQPGSNDGNADSEPSSDAQQRQ